MVHGLVDCYHVIDTGSTVPVFKDTGWRTFAMSSAHLHLLLTHVPVISLVVGVLVMAYALIRRSKDAAQVSMWISVFSALGAVAAYLTGEGAEEVVEHLAGVSEVFIEEHEESALVSMILTVVLGIVSLAGLWYSRKRLPTWLSGGLLVLGVIAGAFMARTAYLGGEVRHSEIRPGAQAAAGTEGGAEAGEAYERKDD